VNLAFISSMFAVGLATSVHCVFMCGGLVLTYAVKGAEEGPWYRRLAPHLVYQGAKILSYAAIALVLAGLVTLAGVAVNEQTTLPVTSWVQVVAGAYMVLLGVGMTGKVKALRYLTPRPPKFLVNALTRERKKAVSEAQEGHASLVTPVVFGLLTGLMPCGPLIAAQVASATQGSVPTGVLGMVAFGIGTMPLMLVFGFASSLLSRQFQAKMQVVAAIGIMIFGLVILNRGLMLVGSPVTFDSVRNSIVGTSPTTGSTNFTKGADGVVEVQLAIVNTDYVPKTVSIPADTPVRLIVDRKEDVACSDQLVIRAAKIQVPLTPNGITKVDLPPMPAGVYQMTCQMGMMSGTLLVGGAAAGGGSLVGLWIALLALIAVVFAIGWWSANKRSRVSSHATANAVSGKKGSRTGATVASKATLLLGFRPVELAIAASVIIMAIVIGLMSGGFFH
ncbi:MAG TPA: sulfite exporter TauE/SafE family protein, partial [Coriobacteriia bacterium]